MSGRKLPSRTVIFFQGEKHFWKSSKNFKCSRIYELIKYYLRTLSRTKRSYVKANAYPLTSL